MRSILHCLLWAIALSLLSAVALASPGRVVIVVAGDIGYPEQFGDQKLIDTKKSGLFAQVQPILDSAQLRFANMECPITNRRPTLRSLSPINCPPPRLGYVVDAGFNLLSIANNHTLDAGASGLRDTLAELRKVNTPARPVWWAGAGMNKVEARRVTRFQLADKTTVAFFAVAATNPEGGVASIKDKRLNKRIAAAASNTDIVIVSVHDGNEYVHVPLAATTQRYRGMIDAGADMVLGTHPHVLQGMERHGAGVIFYSLGNFSFGARSRRYQKQGSRMYSMMGRITVDGGKVARVELIPLYVNNTEPWTLDGRTLVSRYVTPQLLTGKFAAHVLNEIVRFNAAIPAAGVHRTTRLGDRLFLNFGAAMSKSEQAIALAQQKREYQAVIKAKAQPRAATAEELKRKPLAAAELRSVAKPGSLRDLDERRRRNKQRK